MWQYKLVPEKNLVLLNPEPEENHPQKIIFLPVEAFRFAKEYFPANKQFYLIKDIKLQILKTTGGGIEEYLLEIDGIKCIVNQSKLFGSIPLWLFELLKNKPFIKFSNNAPSSREYYFFSVLLNFQEISLKRLYFTYQEAFVNGHLGIQFDWMLGDLLMPSLNLLNRGYEFEIKDKNFIAKLLKDPT